MLTEEQHAQVLAFVEEQTGYKLRPTGVHSCGLPNHEQVGNFVGYVTDPESYKDHYDGFLVYELAVVRASLRDPYNYNNWATISVNEYSDKETLISLLPKKPVPKQSAWDESK